MAYLALYRKYRSQTFGDLVGQPHVVRTLLNGLNSGRFAHAFLFTGPRGTGKTSTARLLAKALNCENPQNGEPCNLCVPCIEITEGRCLDVLEMDAASESGVEDVRRSIVEASDYRPANCRYKVFIIDEVHDLSVKAFDALLKTVEEPPEHVIFVLATTEFHKVPPTIRSRCQKYEFHRASMRDLVSRLEYVVQAEAVEAEPAALSAIARMAEGGFRDALTLLEQAILTNEGKITLEGVYDQLGLIRDESADALLRAIQSGDVSQVTGSLEELFRLGRDPRVILESLLYRLADLTRASYGIEVGGTSDAPYEAALHETAAQLGKDRILHIRSTLADAHKNIREVSLPRLWLEAELVRLAIAPSQPVPIQAVVASQPMEQKTSVKEASSIATKVPPNPKKNQPQNEDIDAANKLWREAIALVTKKSKVLGAKLASTRACEAEGNVLRIEFERGFDLDQIRESSKAAAMIQTVEEALFSASGGRAYKIQFHLASKPEGTTPLKETTVELPLEGEQLVKVGRELFEQL